MRKITIEKMADMPDGKQNLHKILNA